MIPLPGAEITIVHRLCEVYGVAAVLSAIAAHVDNEASLAVRAREAARARAHRLSAVCAELETAVENLDALDVAGLCDRCEAAPGAIVDVVITREHGIAVLVRCDRCAAARELP